MSLINEALKKAQRLQSQQPGAAPEEIAPASGVRPAVVRRGQPMGYEKMVLGLVALVVVVVGTAVVTTLMMRDKGRPVAAAAPSPAVAVPVQSPAPTSPAPIAAVAAPVPAPASPAPAAAGPAIATPPPAAPPTSAPAQPPASAQTPSPTVTIPVASASAPQPAATTPPPVSAPVVEPPPGKPVTPAPLSATTRQNNKILALIDGFRVTGIRAASGDSKVLMNDRVYRLNDLVDYELGLRLTGVTTTVLTFTDENGVTYTKTL